jgi:hypothetical protein
MTVSGLMPGVTYYFAVVAQDEKSNAGDVSNSPSAATTLPTPNNVGTYDDTHAGWIYSSGWTLYGGSGPYNNTNHYNNTAGSYADFVFSGSQFALKYATGTNRGATDVYIDGVKATQINAYSPTSAWQVTYTSPVLSNATHSVRFQVVGGGYSDIDMIQVFGPPDVTPPAAISTLAATGGNGTAVLNWTSVGDDGNTGTATSYLVRYSTSAINSGNWSSATPASGSIPTPKIAGSAETMTVTGLMPGVTYYFAVVAQDEKSNAGDVSNSPSAATTLPTPNNVGTYDDTHAGWIYSSGWTLYSGSGPYNSTNHYNNTAGSYADFVFTGSQFALKYATGSNRGATDVYIDGVKVTQITATNAAAAWQVTYTSPMLSNDTHSVRFQVVGGGYSDIDVIVIQ